MAAVTTTLVDSAIDTKLKESFIEHMATKSVLGQYTTYEKIGKNVAGTLVYNQMIQPAPRTTPVTPGTLRTIADSQSFNTFSRAVTPVLLDGTVSINEDVEWTSILKDQRFIDAMAIQAKESWESYMMKNILCRKLFRVRIDSDATYQFPFTCSGGTTTTLVSADFTGADDTINGGGGFISVSNRSGTNKGAVEKVTDHVDSTNTITVAAQRQAFDSSTKGLVCMATGLTTTDTLSWESTLLMAYHLNKLNNGKRERQFDGCYVAFISPEQELNLLSSTTVTEIGINSRPVQMENYSAWKMNNILFHVTDFLQRETLTGTQSDTGDIYPIPVLTRGAFVAHPWGDYGDGMGIKMIPYNTVDSGNLTGSFRAYSWKIYTGAIVPDGTRGLNMLTSADSVGNAYAVI